MQRCADCDYLVLRDRKGAMFDASVAFRLNGASTERQQGTIHCALGACPLADEVASDGGSRTDPGSVVRILWRLRTCPSHRPIGSGAD